MSRVAQAGGGSTALIVMLAGVTALGPFAMQALSPALPAIASSFAVVPAVAQLMLSLSMVAIAFGTLIWGTLSDRFGRKPMLLLGLALAGAGSILVAIAPNVTIALIGRLVQAGGAAAGLVIARAVAQDIFGREAAAGVIGQITAAMVAAPMIAPSISGLIVATTGWRGIFWIIAAIALGLCLWVRGHLVESLTERKPGQGLRAMLAGFREIARIPDFWRYAIYGGFSLSSFFFFVGSAPYVMQDAYGRGPAAYGAYFILMAATYMASNFVCGRVTRHLGADNTLRLGAALALAGPVISLLLIGAGLDHPFALFLPAMLHSAGSGLAVPNAMAGAVSAAPERAGAASGLLGFGQFMLAAVITQGAGFIAHDVSWPVPFAMAMLTSIGFAAFLWLSPRQR